MLKLGLRSVLAHRLRFVLCTVAVLLGVAFVGGALIFTDTLSAALKKNYAGAPADISVTPATALKNDPGVSNARPLTLTSDLANQIANLPGVASSEPLVLVPGAQILGSDGRPTDALGLPTYAASWPRDRRTATFQLIDGKPPWGKEQLTLDQATAKREGYQIGDQVKVVTPVRAVTAVLTGVTTPSLSGASAGAPLITFDSASAQLLVLGRPGWTSITVAVEPGQDVQAVTQAIAKIAGKDVSVRTAAQVAADGENAIDNSFGGFSAILMLFAGIALFVGTFLIVNTFAMLVAQRSRELAMLRAIGASRGQVTSTVLIEALVIGIAGSTLGLLLGAAVAGALQAFYKSLDLAIPTSSLQISVPTVVACYLVGVGVTLCAAYPAARRAGKLPPVAAMRDDVSIPERSLVLRLVLGAFTLLMTGLLVAIAFTLQGLPAAILVGLAAAIGTLGVVMTSPLITRYAVRALMSPFGRKAPVTLGRRNAERNPRRTSATASALMISLALVSGLVVIAASAKASVDQALADAIGTAELLVSADQPFSSQVGDQVAKVPGVAAVHRVRQLPGDIGTRRVTVAGVDDGTIAGPITTRFLSGSADGLRNGEAVIPRNLAQQLDLVTGQQFELTTSTGKQPLRVSGIIAPNRQLNAVIVSQQTFTQVGGATTDRTLYVEVADGTDFRTVGQAVAAQLTDYPAVQVRDQQAYAQSQRQPIDTVLAVIAMLLTLAVLIAVLGIVNTLALGVIERTREIGLLRAIGMDGPQLRRMLQVEAIAIALLGALLGLLIGVLFGAAVQRVMREDGLGVLDLPVLQLTVAVVVAAAVGVLAAVWPSRRAAKLDVLRAIGSQ
ncbi:ABC transporter permease [Kribbella sp. CA-293567]|uniref:ABC transporter permease n=1 Tax=Kribbella sp. CA-293567 TaxID=3002436 RepID=UPI0022DDD464|nr:FtsX-like permease family protein [Kribbella sp. CA-293567]WBQ08508.1 FtsX-like permease family protein [Kribbella sp. CA-293567]